MSFYKIPILLLINNRVKVSTAHNPIHVTIFVAVNPSCVVYEALCMILSVDWLPCHR